MRGDKSSCDRPYVRYVDEMCSLQLQCASFILCVYFSHGVRPTPLDTAATTGLFYQSQMIADDNCGEIGGMRIGKEN
jgi:hypothetical protein